MSYTAPYVGDTTNVTTESATCADVISILGAHGGRSGHLVLFLVALLFSKLQTFLNNNPEGNPLKLV